MNFHAAYAKSYYDTLESPSDIRQEQKENRELGCAVDDDDSAVPSEAEGIEKPFLASLAKELSMEPVLTSQDVYVAGGTSTNDGTNQDGEELMDVDLSSPSNVSSCCSP